jgi:peptide/nickel transport system permease protein
MAFPAMALGATNVAFVARVTRSTMLEVLREDYIRTARSKGLAEWVVIYRHALKNALLPVITVSGYQFGGLLGGTIIIENIFLIPGMGRIIIVALQQRDYVVIQSVVVLIVMLVLVLNLALDIVYAWVNPRIRYT